MHPTQEHLNIREMLTDIKGETDSNTVSLNSTYIYLYLLISKHRSSRQKINKETQALNDTLDQMDLTDMYIHTCIHTYIRVCVCVCVCVCVYNHFI